MLLKKECHRLFFRWQTWVALLIEFLIIITQAITINPANANFTNNAFLHLTGFDGTGLGSRFYYFILPLTCALAAGSTFQEDKQTHFLKAILARRPTYKYLVTTLTSSFLVGGIIGCLPLIIEGCHFFLHYSVKRLPEHFELMPIAKGGWGYPIFSTHPLLFWLITIIIIFIFSGLFSLISLCASYYELRKGIEIVIPFGIVFISLLLSNLLNISEISITYLITPTFSNDYPYSFYALIGYFLLGIGTVALLTWRKSKKDVFD